MGIYIYLFIYLFIYFLGGMPDIPDVYFFGKQ